MSYVESQSSDDDMEKGESESEMEHDPYMVCDRNPDDDLESFDSGTTLELSGKPRVATDLPKMPTDPVGGDCHDDDDDDDDESSAEEDCQVRVIACYVIMR